MTYPCKDQSNSFPKTLRLFAAIYHRRPLLRFGAGLIISGGISWVAWRRGMLQLSGAFGAASAGTMIVGRGGPGFAAMVVNFFLSSSFVSQMFRETTIDDSAELHPQRSLLQVVANGGIPAILALQSAPPARVAIFIGALSAVSSDTWATEIGRHSRVTPVSIVTGMPVKPGTSGGVTPAGFIASIAGALWSGVGFLVSRPVDSALHRLTPSHGLLIALGAGTIGALIDSILGAAIQVRYRCPDCNLILEKSKLCCDHLPLYESGVPGINNDIVNLLTSLTGAVTGLLMYRSLSRKK